MVTLVLNLWWIPLGADHLIHGYMGSAWATFICYGLMMVISYIVGQHYLPVKYNLVKFFGCLGSAILLLLVSVLVIPGGATLRILFHTFLLVVFAAGVYLVEKPALSVTR